VDVPGAGLSHAETFRHSVPIRVTAYYVLLAGCVVVSGLGIYPLPVGRFALVILGLTLVLVLCYRRALASRAWAVGYLACEGLALTVLAHFGGDYRIIVSSTYLFEVMNPGLRLGRLGYYAVGNGLAALYALLILAEQAGILAAPTGTVIPPLLLSVASSVLAFLVLNLASFFTSEIRLALESRTLELAYAKQALQAHSEELERRVHDRTAELEVSYRALSEKAEELRTFVYTVTHDLKNPVSAILLTADLMLQRDGSALAPEGRGDLERIVRLAGDTEDMIRDLMGFFRITSAPEMFEMVDLGRLVREALAHLGPQIAAKAVRVDVEPLPSVWGQPGKLGHVVTNLLSNAVKYVPAGRGEVRVTGAVTDGHVLFSVADNGIGIRREYQEGIFDLFGRVPQEDQIVDGAVAGGTGVGLAMVRQIVEAHRGTVAVESAREAGSRFVVRLPVRTPHG
jgi:signal transduction histidine kinase